MSLSGELDPNLSRWLWLVKWLLAIPHIVILVFLWIAFLVSTIIAFFGILFTERYPLGLFNFNIGVLRWHWRVVFYCLNVLWTDRYPPFSLESADYPAALEIQLEDERIAELIFSGVSTLEIATETGLTTRAVRHFMAGKRRPYIKRRVRELIQEAASQTQELLLRMHRESLETLRECLGATKLAQVGGVPREIPDNATRIRASPRKRSLRANHSGASRAEKQARLATRAAVNSREA